MTQIQFEQAIGRSVQQSVLGAANPQEAAAIALDILLVNSIMLTGVVEKGCKGKNSIHRIVNRLERLTKMLKQGEKKANFSGPVEGEPVTPEEQPKLVDFTPKGHSRIVKPPGFDGN
jgi:hypothetical protein